MRNRVVLHDTDARNLSTTDVSGEPVLDVNLVGILAQDILDTLQDILAATGGGSKTSLHLLRNDYTGTPVTTAAYVQLLASTSDEINQLYIFDSSGKTLVLAVGGAGSEVDKYYIVPGGNGLINLTIPVGSRLSIKAVSGTANKGEISITCLK
jgi:hypothetical protein